MIKDDGGPAFPQDPKHDEFAEMRGMSLRDWFAGQALAGETVNYDYYDGKEGHRPIAERCYAIADAMLEARNAGK